MMITDKTEKYDMERSVGTRPNRVQPDAEISPPSVTDLLQEAEKNNEMLWQRIGDLDSIVSSLIGGDGVAVGPTNDGRDTGSRPQLTRMAEQVSATTYHVNRLSILISRLAKAVY